MSPFERFLVTFLAVVCGMVVGNILTIILIVFWIANFFKINTGG